MGSEESKPTPKSEPIVPYPAVNMSYLSALPYVNSPAYSSYYPNVPIPVPAQPVYPEYQYSYPANQYGTPYQVGYYQPPAVTPAIIQAPLLSSYDDDDGRRSRRQRHHHRRRYHSHSR